MRDRPLVTRSLFALMFVLMCLGIGCISNKRIQDYTVERSSVCEVHHLAMKERIVPQTFGMTRSGWILKLRNSRQQLFPHAAEIYDTYACLPSDDDYARVYVCAECSTVREKWLAENPPEDAYDRQYVEQCNSISKTFHGTMRSWFASGHEPVSDFRHASP